MRKIWTVFDNLDLVEIGAYWFEDEALQVKKSILDDGLGYEPEDIIVSVFEVHE